MIAVHPPKERPARRRPSSGPRLSQLTGQSQFRNSGVRNKLQNLKSSVCSVYSAKELKPFETADAETGLSAASFESSSSDIAENVYAALENAASKDELHEGYPHQELLDILTDGKQRVGGLMQKLQTENRIEALSELGRWFDSHEMAARREMDKIKGLEIQNDEMQKTISTLKSDGEKAIENMCEGPVKRMNALCDDLASVLRVDGPASSVSRHSLALQEYKAAAEAARLEKEGSTRLESTRQALKETQTQLLNREKSKDLRKQEEQKEMLWIGRAAQAVEAKKLEVQHLSAQVDAVVEENNHMQQALQHFLQENDNREAEVMPQPVVDIIENVKHKIRKTRMKEIRGSQPSIAERELTARTSERMIEEHKVMIRLLKQRSRLPPSEDADVTEPSVCKSEQLKSQIFNLMERCRWLERKRTQLESELQTKKVELEGLSGHKQDLESYLKIAAGNLLAQGFDDAIDSETMASAREWSSQVLSVRQWQNRLQQSLDDVELFPEICAQFLWGSDAPCEGSRDDVQCDSILEKVQRGADDMWRSIEGIEIGYRNGFGGQEAPPNAVPQLSSDQNLIFEGIEALESVLVEIEEAAIEQELAKQNLHKGSEGQDQHTESHVHHMDVNDLAANDLQTVTQQLQRSNDRKTTTSSAGTSQGSESSRSEFQKRPRAHRTPRSKTNTGNEPLRPDAALRRKTVMTTADAESI